ncbi:exo-alpha-sialidase [Fulvivirgaceae bacterium BMA10]|uniref:exo-alpha-sialidase n=1 Tax=Splendidivirga corallicola TaxID=3051826 RepID=A0ABT8KIU7_9BACT|nr:exo-alpha-sialidase [Fulvivirgaceae bacterium BMA10]
MRSIFTIFFVLVVSAIEAQDPKIIDVFVGGENGYGSYRIPSIINTNNGTLLAFCEGRKTKSDHAENDIVLKRSTDNGDTWQALQILAEDGANSLNNPQAVVVGRTGRVILMYQRYPKGFHEREVVPGYKGEKICRNFVMYSDDEGKTWSIPKDITDQVKRPTYVTSIAGGPGIGIQLTRGKYQGRIIMPFNQGPFNKWKVYAVFSDDEGASWQYGDTAPDAGQGVGNEVQMVELSDGSVMLNSRSSSGTKHRKIAISHDGGANWTGMVDDKQLIEPQCQGSILRYSFPEDGQRSVLLFANPASRNSRTNGSVRASFDDGKSWPVVRTIYQGSFAYSCLTKLSDAGIGLLFERDNYDRISFSRLNLEWLRATSFSTYYLQKKSHFESLPDEENEIVFLGNSITDGANWAELLGEASIKNRGISGDVTDGILNRIDEVTNARPSKIFLMIGINDLAFGLSVEEILFNYEKIIKEIKIKSPSTDLYIQSILPVNDQFGRFRNHTNKKDEILALNKKLKVLAKKYKVNYVDLYNSFILSNNQMDPKYTNDGLHLTGEGYLLWKSLIVDLVKE